MAFEKQRLPSDRVETGVEYRERHGRPEDVVAVMHHAVRMTVGLVEKRLFRDFLMVLSLVRLGINAQVGEHTDTDQDDDEERDNSERQL